MHSRMRSIQRRPTECPPVRLARHFQDSLNRSATASLVQVCWACLAICLVLTAGCCSTGYLALRTLVCEPRQYCFKIDRCRSRSLYREWAEQQLQQAAGSCAESPLAADYKAGFIDGFVDFVDSGGNGEPPPVPPRQYWNVALRSQEGKERANQWLEGFRQGARVAADGGYRDFGIIHTSLGESPAQAKLNATRPPDAATQTPGAEIESLPTPPASEGEHAKPAPVGATPPSTPGVLKTAPSAASPARPLDEPQKSALPPDDNGAAGQPKNDSLPEPADLPIERSRAESVSPSDPAATPNEIPVSTSTLLPTDNGNAKSSEQPALKKELAPQAGGGFPGKTAQTNSPASGPTSLVLSGGESLPPGGVPPAPLVKNPFSEQSVAHTAANTFQQNLKADDRPSLSKTSTTDGSDSPNKDDRAGGQPALLAKPAPGVVASPMGGDDANAEKLDEQTSREKYRAAFFAR
jgi:hypothetical protein